MVAAAMPVADVPFVTVGGGIGSFATVDRLRVHGVPAERIRVITDLDHPAQTYERLTRWSQLPPTARIGTGSRGRPDAPWCFPSYALEEAWRERSPRPLPGALLRRPWSPRAATVLAGLEREAARIGYADMTVKGSVHVVRRREDGGYFTVLTGPDGAPRAYRSRYVHLAVGRPGLRLLPDLQRYRSEYGDRVRVVSAYEPHEHVYAALRDKAGTVMVRGGGGLAARVLRRLIEDREAHGLQTRVVQAFRTVLARPSGPERRAWQARLRDGAAHGWYHCVRGVVDLVEPGPGGRVVAHLRREGGRHQFLSDFIIDCAALPADIAEHQVLADLLARGGARRGPLDRLEVARSFEVTGAASGDGALYASGPAALGVGVPADTFRGLQRAAREITADLTRRGFCPPLGPVAATGQWLRWARGVPVR